MTTAKRTLLALCAVGLVACAAGRASADLRVEAVYSSEPVDVRVWMDRGYGTDDWNADETWGYCDVYPSVDDVVLYVRAARSCYATVYVIDTEGFIHIVYPFSPFDDAYLSGGRIHRLYLRDYGFSRSCFGRGVAFAFVVTSPVPFGYAGYGMTAFGPHVGFQVYGDPFVAARMFYLSILPHGCAPSFTVVSYARFYVTEYVRYPSYLCPGWHEHNGVRTYCGGQCAAYRDYRINAKDPFRVLRPAATVDAEAVRYTKIERTGAKDPGDIRVVAPRSGKADPVADARGTVERPSVKLDGGVSKDRTVRSTRDEFVASRQNYERMREIYQKSGETRDGTVNPPSAAKPTVKTKSVVAPREKTGTRETANVPTREVQGGRSTAKVTKSAPGGARETVALRSAQAKQTKESSKTGKGGKRDGS
jgi:hypothetical protein